jgi:outer membrane protein OmpA-like peptidoglycan-associated protein
LDKGAPIGTDLAKYLSIKPIYFDFNKSVIREDAQEILKKILAYLDEYPDAKVEVRSHTDSRASTEYNMALSQRRAKATVDYLVSKGVNPSRIRGVGFGESQLTNDCANSIKCSEEKHQRNRRSEFILVE